MNREESVTPEKHRHGSEDERLWDRIVWSGVLTEAEQTADSLSWLMRKKESAEESLRLPVVPYPIPQVVQDHFRKVNGRDLTEEESAIMSKPHDWGKSVEQYCQSIAERMTPEAAELLKDGWESFRERTVGRVLRDHWAEVMNPCPRCGAPTRTPQARQCPKCFYRWKNDKVSLDERPAL